MPPVFTVMQLVVAPLLHKKEPVPVAQSSVEPPSQRIKPPVIEQRGSGLTTTVDSHVLLHPPAMVMVTE